MEVPKDIHLKHEDIKSPQKITKVTNNAMVKAGLNIHHNEVKEMYDDFDKGVRVLSVETPRMYFTNSGFGEGKIGCAGKYKYDADKGEMIKVD